MRTHETCVGTWGNCSLYQSDAESALPAGRQCNLDGWRLQNQRPWAYPRPVKNLFCGLQQSFHLHL